MKKNILILLLLLISFFIEAEAQGDSLKTKANILTVSITQLLIRDLQLSYERFITPKSSLEFTTGIKLAKNTDHVLRGQLYLDTYLPYENSYYLSLAYRLNLINTMDKSSATEPHIYGLYLGFRPFYRYNTYKNKCYEFTVGSTLNSYTQIDSRNQHIFGSYLYLGARCDLFANKEKLDVILDVYLGAGALYKKTHVVEYAWEFGAPPCESIERHPSPRVKNGSRIDESDINPNGIREALIVGIKVGMRF